MEHKESVEEFIHIRSALKQNRRRFTEFAYWLPMYDDGRNISNVPLLCDESWLIEPIRLHAPDSMLQGIGGQMSTFYDDNLNNSSSFDIACFNKQSRSLLPEGENGRQFDSYHDAIKRIENPPISKFVNRPCFRLLKIDAEQASFNLRFGKAQYFDYLDTGEVLGHELIDRIALYGQSGTIPKPSEWELSLRSTLGKWQNVGSRISIAGINNLTIIRERENATFLLMRRGQDLASANGAIHVIPAGEFQPISIPSGNEINQCTIWQTLFREFSEEILLSREAKFAEVSIKTLASIEPINMLRQMANDSEWITWFLGIGIDPINLKLEMLTVTVINKPSLRELLNYSKLQSSLPQSNEEGALLLRKGGWGDDLTKENLMKHAFSDHILPAGAACLSLTAKHLDKIAPWILSGSIY